LPCRSDKQRVPKSILDKNEIKHEFEGCHPTGRYKNAHLGLSPRLRRWILASAAGVAACAAFFVCAHGHAVADSKANHVTLVEDFKHDEVTSISDASEQLLHENRDISHNMRPIFPTRFAGTALTVKLEKQENTTSADLNGMLEAIDKEGSDRFM
jgi:hypothetical protein